MDHNTDPSGEKITKGSYLTIGFIPEDKVNKLGWVPVTSPTSWVKHLTFSYLLIIVSKVNRCYRDESGKCRSKYRR